MVAAQSPRHRFVALQQQNHCVVSFIFWQMKALAGFCTSCKPWGYVKVETRALCISEAVECHGRDVVVFDCPSELHEEHPLDRIANLPNRTIWIGARIRKLSGSRRDRACWCMARRGENESVCKTAFCRRYNAAEEKRSKNAHGAVLASRVVSRTGTVLMVDMPR
jgi:hypothetical protein